MGKLGDVDLGVILDIARVTKRSSSTVLVNGSSGSFTQDLISEQRSWTLEGSIYDPTQTQQDRLENLYGEVVLLDALEVSRFGYVKVVTGSSHYDGRPKRLGYSLELASVPAIGFTRSLTSDVYLHDLDYRHNLETFDPHHGRFAVTYSAGRLEVDWSFYVDNDSVDAETALLEFQAGDNLASLELWGWKAAAWSLIGHWGGEDAWDAVKAWTDDDAVSHDFRANTGLRGAAVAGIGTLSLGLGCQKRVLLSIATLSAEGATDLSTAYGSDQLLLKAKLVHTSLESARAYPRITYVDGSLGYGIA